MAVRSGWLHQRQVEFFQRRAVPEVSTLENPPGAENTGSAWDLPELQAVIADTSSSSVEFNTCAYQTKLKQRWYKYKPARWTGKLESLESLTRVCKCQPWVQHVPLVGKKNAEAAGAYPEELTAIIAKKVSETWKRVLNLEWLRYQMKQKTDKINELQVKWLQNEERRRKRIYEETAPSDYECPHKRDKVLQEPHKGNTRESGGRRDHAVLIGRAVEETTARGTE